MALTEQQFERYARHLILDEVGEEGQAKLMAARVLVVGAGGLGSPVLLYLAAAGIGTLGIVDDDTVDLSNLQRQIVHPTSRIGAAKVESARATIAAVNPEVRVETHAQRLDEANAAALVKRYDLVADGSDNFATRYLLNDVCFAERRTLVGAALSPFEGQLSTFKAYLGPPHPCYRCLFREPPPPDLVPRCETAGILGAVAGPDAGSRNFTLAPAPGWRAPVAAARRSHRPRRAAVAARGEPSACWQRASSRAARTSASNCSMRNGSCKCRHAKPSSVAVMAGSPVISTTGMPRAQACAASSRPCIPGITKSSTMRSGASLSKRASASSPDEAPLTRKAPSSSSAVCTMLRMAGWSSITRTCGIARTPQCRLNSRRLRRSGEAISVGKQIVFRAGVAIKWSQCAGGARDR